MGMGATVRHASLRTQCRNGRRDDDACAPSTALEMDATNDRTRLAGVLAFRGRAAAVRLRLGDDTGLEPARATRPCASGRRRPRRSTPCELPASAPIPHRRRHGRPRAPARSSVSRGACSQFITAQGCRGRTELSNRSGPGSARRPAFALCRSRHGATDPRRSSPLVNVSDDDLQSRMSLATPSRSEARTNLF